MHTIKGYKDEWRIQEYLLITFFISWLSWGILILLTALKFINFQSVLGIIIFMIGGFGPTIAAIICMEGKLSAKKILNFIFDHRAKTFWIFLILVVAQILVVALSSSQTNPAFAWYVLPLIFIGCTLIGGGNEELGWRGTLQPVLTRTFAKRFKNPVLRFTITMLVIGLIWGLWHLPLWFVAGSAQQGVNFGLFIIATIFQAFWLGCIYARTRSVFFCMLFHGLSNVLMSFFVIQINWILIAGYITMTILAIILGARASSSNHKITTKAKS